MLLSILPRSKIFPTLFLGNFAFANNPVGQPVLPDCIMRLRSRKKARKMQPLIHFEASEPEKCNPYCILGPRRHKNATLIAFWGLGARKLQPLLHSGASVPENCNPYFILGPRRPKKATPTAVWGLGGQKMQPL